MKMMPEAYLDSRMRMNRENALPAWLLEGEYRGLGMAAILKDFNEERNERRPEKDKTWRLPKLKEART
jgi:hypothetical protein